MRLLWFSLLFHKCVAVIYTLNASEHDRMPALYAVDDYDRCLVRGGVYCVVRLDLHADPPNDLMTQIQEYSAHSLKHYNYTFVERGICINTTCQEFIENENTSETADLNDILERCLNKSMMENYGLQSKVSNVIRCEDKSSELEIDVSDWIVLGILLTFIGVNVIGSLYDILICKSFSDTVNMKGNKYLLCFSIIKNWKSMISNEAGEPRLESLKVFHGIKNMTTFYITMAHSVTLASAGYFCNPHYYEMAHESIIISTLNKSAAIVHIFFVISSFLMVYNLEISAEKKPISWKTVPKNIFRRFWRLTPSYAVVLAINVTWLRHLDAGPAWTLLVLNRSVAQCCKYWWLHLLYLNNFEPEDKHCLVHTWYLAADFQLYCLGLLIYFMVRRRGWSLMLTVLLVAGSLVPAIQVWLQNLEGSVVCTPETIRSHDNDTLFLMRIRGYTNIISYATGMALGYLVYEMQKKKIVLSQNKILQYASWTAFPGFFVLMYLESLLHSDGYQAPMLLRMIDAVAHNVVSAALAGLLIFSTVMRCSGYLCAVLRWLGSLVPPKLSYGVYLVHMTITAVLAGFRRQLTRISFFYLFINFLGILAFSYLLAIPLYLMVEAPLGQLLKVFKSSGNSTQNKSKAN